MVETRLTHEDVENLHIKSLGGYFETWGSRLLSWHRTKGMCPVTDIFGSIL